MTEQISIRRYLKAGVVVNVTHKMDGVSVHWAERVLGPTPESIEYTIQLCRRKCRVLMDGVSLACE